MSSYKSHRILVFFHAQKKTQKPVLLNHRIWFLKMKHVHGTVTQRNEQSSNDQLDICLYRSHVTDSPDVLYFLTSIKLSIKITISSVGILTGTIQEC